MDDRWLEVHRGTWVLAAAIDAVEPMIFEDPETGQDRQGSTLTLRSGKVVSTEISVDAVLSSLLGTHQDYEQVSKEDSGPHVY